MDTQTAAQLLSVAEHEVVQVRQDETGWYALHHDMASHEETWRGPLRPVTHAGWFESGVPAAAQTLPDPLQEAEPVVRDVAADGPGVPDGTAAQVLEWVGDDKARAAAALAAERARDKPRGTLVGALEKLAS